ncbi:MAG TPA: RHS repeat-associated core domain-containing protein [Terracidiphilus sp.]
MSSNGFGATGNTITIPGEAPYQLTWESQSPSFAIDTNLVYNGNTSGCSLPGSNGGNLSVVKSIQLPNGKLYNLKYGSDDPNNSNPYSLISQITHPSGGWIKYTWAINHQSAGGVFPNLQGQVGQCFWRWGKPALQSRTISFDGVTAALKQTYQYSTTWGPTGNTTSYLWNTKQTTITTQDLVRGTSFVTTYSYSPNASSGEPNPIYIGAQWNADPQIPVEQTITYKDTNGATLETVSKTWYNAQQLHTEQHTFGSQTSQKSYTYGSGGQITEVDEFDFGQSTATRKTVNTYQSLAATPIFPTAATIFDRLCKTVVSDGSGNRASETDYLYDGGTTVCGTAPTPALSGTGSYSNHDEANYGTTATVARANLTSEIKQCFFGTTSCTNNTTTYAYDEAGQLTSSTDPCGNAACSDMTGSGHTTTYIYSDSYTVLSGGTNVSYTPTVNTNALLTKVTDPLGHINTFKYDFNSGQLTTSTDPNGAITTYLYNDPLVRPTLIVYPDLGQTSYTYNDSSYSSTANTPNVTATKKITSTTNEVTVAASDGIGHTVRTLLTSDPNGTVYTDTSIDGMGRVRTVSTPYYTTSDQTYGITTYTYDALGRITLVQHPDGSSASTTYSGRATMTADEGNGTRSVQRIAQSDGLDRLKSVCEVTTATLPVGSSPTPTACGLDIGATGFVTTYSYDTLDNLISASQGNLNARTFAYDSLSRLLCSANPEVATATCPNPDNGSYTAGTIRFTYDAIGDLSSRKAPLPNQTNISTTVTTSHTYDVLNRMKSTSYSDGSTPSNYFAYDQSSVWGYTLNNTIGRMTSESRTVAGQNSQYIFSYDPMGRAAFQRRCVPINCGGSPGSYLLAYTYDLAGNVTSASNGMAATISYGPYNGANELTSVTSSLSDATHPGTLMSGMQYGPFGKFITAAVGNSAIYEHFTYSNRGFPTSFWACTVSGQCDSNTLLYTYAVLGSAGMAPNGNILNVTDTVNGTWTYTYDDFNRLSTAVSTGGLGCSWDYDRFGNRWHQKTYNGSCTTPTFSFTGNNNRIDGYSYDAAGNLLNDGVHSYTYDAENRIWKVDGGSTATYVYDAEGQRIQRTVGGASVDYLYDTAGHQITEIGSTGGWNRGEVYAAGLHLATYDNSTTHFTFSDWLGTERSRATLTGAVCGTTTSLPFGDNQVTSGSCSNSSPMHFTGKERDTESGLDNFETRYYGSNLGRFTRPDDAFADQQADDPQSWNIYSYVRNNPLSNTDPSGHECVSDVDGRWTWSGSGETCEDVEAQNREYKGSGQASVTVNGCADDPALCLSFMVSDLTTTSSLSEVGVNGMIGAQTAEGVAELPGLFRSGWDVVSGWRMASKMAGVRAAGEAGELAAGIVKNTERIPSTTGAAYRIPDILDKTQKIIGEVKNYTTTKVYLTNQLKDDLRYAAKNGFTMELRVRQGTQLSQSVQQLVGQGIIKLIRF